MNRKKIVDAWATTGLVMEALVSEKDNTPFSDEYEQVCRIALRDNPWFTRESVDMAVRALSTMLAPTKLGHWIERYATPTELPRRIGIIAAGNIPMAGFHDVLCVLSAGHHAVLRLSSSDRQLIPFITKIFFHFLPEMSCRFHVNEPLKPLDGIIATGSNNTSRYFEYYFGKIPHLLRKNRNSVAILTGQENEYDLLLLGRDIFTYFGLGCRSVSKLYVPEGYVFDEFFQNMMHYSGLLQHTRYMNNHDYHQALFLLNNEPILTNNFLILRPEVSLSSPVGVLHYEPYNSEEDLNNKLAGHSDRLQCIIGKKGPVPFGNAQAPEIEDYADGVDTMNFLNTIK